jgi:predicted phage terminase large subunit-like protein
VSNFIPLLDFIPEVSPRYDPPQHLAPLANVFQRIAEGDEVRVVVSVPPRFAKTETILHGCAWLLALSPHLRVIYASHSQRIAERKSRKARELAKRAGVPLASDAKARSSWLTDVDDGGMFATSPEGAITGEGADVLVLDDLVKGRAEAESGGIRERNRAWLLSDALTRLEPRGSVIVNATRWHPEDPCGVAIGLGFEVINMQAITPAGESLWPQRWPLSRLHEIRETLGGEDGYEWQSLYMGNPRGRGSRVFGDVELYDELPEKFKALLAAGRARVSVGLDFGYSTRTSADFSVAVVLVRFDDSDDCYVLDVVRVHEEPRDFRERIRNLITMYGGSAYAYAASTELGGIEFIRDGQIPITAHIAKADKFSRAIPVSAAWNAKRIKVPRNAPWADKFVSEVCGFTGVKDRHDDQVDALAAAFDAIGGTGHSIDWLDDDDLESMSSFDDHHSTFDHDPYGRKGF